MFFWYIGLSVFGVATIFRSVGVDYRLIALGSLLPIAIDLPWGHRAVGSSLALPVAMLAVVMIATIGRSRLTRRRLLCVPIGVFTALVLSGGFSARQSFWWPLFGWEFPSTSIVATWWVVLLEEIAGLVACWVVVGLYDLYLPEPRAEFLRTGRLRLGA